MRKTAQVRKILSTLVILIIFGFLLRTLLVQWDQMSKEFVRFDLLLLAISFIPLICNQALVALIWKDALKTLGSGLSWREAFKIISFSQLARYLPGRVWGALSLIHLASGRGISPACSFGAFVFLKVNILLLAGAIAFAFLMEWKTGMVMNPWWLMLPLIMILVALHPGVLRWWTARLLRLLLREAQPIRMGYRQSLWLLLLAALYWGLAAVGIYLLTLAIIPSYNGGLFFLLGTLAISWVSGYLAFFTPGGLGVREGVMASLLALALPGSAAVLVALAVRVRLILCEALAAGMAYFLGRS